MADQLCIFVENKPGKLEAITKALAEARINVRGISMADAGEFGVVRLIAGDPERAAQVLKEARFTVSRRRIVVALIDDEPGSLHRVLELLSAQRINIGDCYGIVLSEPATSERATSERGSPAAPAAPRRAAVVLEVEKFPEAERVLSEAGIRLLADEAIYSI